MSTKAINRRDFLKTTAAGGTALVIGFYWPAPGELAAAEGTAASFAPNAWLRIDTAGLVTVIVDRSEMGQGVMTSLPMLLAEELEADWSKVRIESAPAEPVYANRIFEIQATGGSTSIRAAFDFLREAGAAAREMLITAAAETWGVEKSTCRAEKGEVIHTPTGRRLGYGALVERASKLPVPKDVPLKSPKDWRILGKPTRRLDTPDKIAGRAVFGIDVRVPGMLFASVARCPVFGGKVASFDATKAKAVKGVRHVVEISSGVAVAAENTWAAMEGRRALQIKWDEGPNAEQSSAAITRRFEERAKEPGVVVRKEGDAAAALASAHQKIEAVYEVPFLAHATMEPMNATADVRKDACEVWVPTQNQTGVKHLAGQLSGLAENAVRVHTTYLGGGFGRRFELDFVREPLEVSKAVGAPVQVLWTREDDIEHDVYRPATYNRLVAALDADGWPVAWTHRIVGPSISARFDPEVAKKGMDPTSIEGAFNVPYAIPNIFVDYGMVDTGIPVGYWRSVGSSQNAYITECFFDEVARAGGKDPYELRRRLLKDKPRHRAALELAAEKAGWGTPLPAGHGRGIAVHESFGSYVAQCAEVSVGKDGVRVHRVVCAVDCGMVVNPDTVKAQMESGIIFGLTAALHGAITIAKGRVEQNNFYDYEMVRMNEAPAIEVYIVPSEERPGGVGEPGTPPIAPAVVNALFAATGKPVRRLPIPA